MTWLRRASLTTPVWIWYRLEGLKLHRKVWALTRETCPAVVTSQQPWHLIMTAENQEWP